MMASLFLVLSAVGFLMLSGLAALAIVLLRESRKLDGAADLEGRLAAMRADVAALAKQHNALDELVGVKLNRLATTEKRVSKAQKATAAEEKPETQQQDIFFPSLTGYPQVEQ